MTLSKKRYSLAELSGLPTLHEHASFGACKIDTDLGQVWLASPDDVDGEYGVTITVVRKSAYVVVQSYAPAAGRFDGGRS